MTIENKEFTPRDRQEADLKDRTEYNAKVQAALAPIANRNTEYFAKQEALTKQISKQNEYNRTHQPTPRTNQDAIAELDNRFPHRKSGLPEIDVLADQPGMINPQDRDRVAVAPRFVPKPSLVAETKPAERFVPPPQTFKPLTEAELQASRDRCEMAMVKRS